MPTLLAEAKAYADRYRWAIIPVRDKVPSSGQWRRYCKVSPTERQLRGLFTIRGVNGLAVLPGEVSDGLCVRDYDKEGAYESWAKAHPDLASLLPTVRTHRGHHVYFRSAVANVSAGWTGYTHQWRSCNEEYRRYLMASCETALQREQAVSMGWRTFRARLAHEPLEKGEFSCPASAEEGRRLTCEECGACDGAKPSPRAASPSIVFHAPGNGAGDWMRSNYERTVTRLQEEEASRRVPLAVR
jgi:hypothetical protein